MNNVGKYLIPEIKAIHLNNYTELLLTTHEEDEAAPDKNHIGGSSLDF